MTSAAQRPRFPRLRLPRVGWICRSLLPVCLVALFSARCSAQDFPRWEISGAFEYDIIGRVPGRGITVTTHGPEGGLAYSFNRYFRIAGQFDAGFANRIIDLRVLPPGYHHYNDKMLLGFVGPEFVFRRPDRMLQVYAHYLPRIAYARDNEVPPDYSTPTGLPIAPAATASSWANAVGSGIDLKFGHQASFRVLEVDYMRTDFPNNPHSNWRFLTGFVLRLGGGK
jgi:hypothetical protein